MPFVTDTTTWHDFVPKLYKEHQDYFKTEAEEIPTLIRDWLIGQLQMGLAHPDRVLWDRQEEVIAELQKYIMQHEKEGLTIPPAHPQPTFYVEEVLIENEELEDEDEEDGLFVPGYFPREDEDEEEDEDDLPAVAA